MQVERARKKTSSNAADYHPQSLPRHMMANTQLQSLLISVCILVTQTTKGETLTCLLYGLIHSFINSYTRFIHLLHRLMQISFKVTTPRCSRIQDGQKMTIFKTEQNSDRYATLRSRRFGPGHLGTGTIRLLVNKEFFY